MKVVLLVVIVIISLLLQACSFIATTTGMLESPKEEVLPAAKKVSQQLSYRTQEGPLDAEVYALVPPFFSESVPVPNADLFLQKDGDNLWNNTGSTGAIRLSYSGPKTTEYVGVFGTSAGDPKANGLLFLELTRQQIAMDAGLQRPHSNPLKSASTYVGLNCLSPVLSAHYLANGNPLLSKSMTPYLYLQNSIGDVFLVGLIAAGLLSTDSSNRSARITAGISIGVVWRLLTLLNLTDLNDYNGLARTPYDLSVIHP